MIETQAHIVREDGEHAWVVIRPHTPCGNCDPVTGCKSVAISRLFGTAGQEFRVRNPQHYACGSKVTLGVAEQSLLGSALWGYGLPLLALLLGAGLGQLLAGAWGAVAGAVLGMLLAFAGLRGRKRLPGVGEPAIVGLAAPEAASCAQRIHGPH